MALGNNLKKQGGQKKNIPGDQPAASEEKDVQVNGPGEPTRPEAMVTASRSATTNIDKAADSLILVVFSVEKEEYAMTIDSVSEVVKTPPIAPIPQVPDYIRGVANVRGNVVTILDLGLKMGLTHDLSKFPNHLMVIKSDEYRIAVGVDQVPNTLMIKKTEIDDSSELMFHSALDEVYIKGIIKKEQRMIILIDILEMMGSEVLTE